MKTESFFENYLFKLYQVRLLAESYKRYSAEKRTAQEQFEELEEILDEDIYPTMTYPDYETGQLFVRSVDVEETVIRRIAAKEILLKKIEWLQKRTDLFELAVSELSHRERQVLNVLFFGGDYGSLGLSPSYFKEIEQEVISKVYSYYDLARKEERKKIKQEQLENLTKRVLESQLAV